MTGGAPVVHGPMLAPPVLAPAAIGTKRFALSLLGG